MCSNTKKGMTYVKRLIGVFVITDLTLTYIGARFVDFQEYIIARALF